MTTDVTPPQAALREKPELEDFHLESRPCPRCGVTMLYDEGEPWDGPTWNCSNCENQESASGLSPPVGNPALEKPERERFEAWASEEKLFIDRNCDPRTSDLSYLSASTNISWRAWLARAAEKDAEIARLRARVTFTESVEAERDTLQARVREMEVPARRWHVLCRNVGAGMLGVTADDGDNWFDDESDLGPFVDSPDAIETTSVMDRAALAAAAPQGDTK